MLIEFLEYEGKSENLKLEEIGKLSNDIIIDDCGNVIFKIKKTPEYIQKMYK